MLLKRAVNRLLRLLPAGEPLSGSNSAEVIETVFRKSRAYVPPAPLIEAGGKRSVLDFGGGFGIHYRQASLISPDIRWAVIETPQMARRADELCTSRLRFFSSISEAARWLGPVDMIYSNGALQYCNDPLATITDLCRIGAREIIWKRVAFSKSQQVEHNTQHIGLSHCGPGISVSRRVVRNTRILIPETLFLSAHQPGYTLAERGAESFRFVAQ